MTTSRSVRQLFKPVASLSSSYRAVLKKLASEGVLIGRGTFALVFQTYIKSLSYVVKVPRYEPSQRIAICLQTSSTPPSIDDVDDALPEGQYLYTTLSGYLKREKAMLQAATHRLPRIFRIVRPQTPQHPHLENVNHIVMQTAVMTLRDVWLQHKSGYLTITNAYLICVLRQLLLQLAILHHKGMTHGDLRLANFLVFMSPHTIVGVEFNLGPAGTTRSPRIMDVAKILFRSGSLELVKLGDYGNAFYVDAFDKSQHRRQYDVLEKVLFQDLDASAYAGARKVFWQLRDGLLVIDDVRQYPKHTYLSNRRP